MEIKTVLLGAIGSVYEVRKPLAKALLIPFIFYMGLEIIEYYETDVVTDSIAVILGLLVHTVFAVTTHRMILLGPAAVSPGWTMRETVFAIHFFLLGLISIPIFIIAAFIPVAGIIIGIGLFCWMLGRLSLVFPAIAIGKNVSFGYSWKKTSDYQLLMFGVVILLPILFYVPSMLLSFIPYTMVLISFIDTFATVFVVASLSVAYKLIHDDTFAHEN